MPREAAGELRPTAKPKMKARSARPDRWVGRAQGSFFAFPWSGIDCEHCTNRCSGKRGTPYSTKTGTSRVRPSSSSRTPTRPPSYAVRRCPSRPTWQRLRGPGCPAGGPRGRATKRAGRPRLSRPPWFTRSSKAAAYVSESLGCEGGDLNPHANYGASTSS